MKRLLIATVLAASTLGLANIAMAADNGDTQDLSQAQTQTARTQFGGSSSGSFGAQQATQYNTDNGE